jgi:hypothetical protein
MAYHPALRKLRSVKFDEAFKLFLKKGWYTSKPLVKLVGIQSTVVVDTVVASRLFSALLLLLVRPSVHNPRVHRPSAALHWERR